MLDYFSLLYHYYLFSIVYIILFLFSFLLSYYFYFQLSNSICPCVEFAVLSRICVIVFIINFIIIFPVRALKRKMYSKDQKFHSFFLQTYMKARFNYLFIIIIYEDIMVCEIVF